MVTPKHLETLLLKNYIYVVALAPSLRRVLLYSVTAFPHYGSTIGLLSLLILIKVSYPNLRASLACLRSLSALWLATACRFMQVRHTGRYSDQTDHGF